MCCNIEWDVRAKMTTDYRLFTTALISHYVSKGYERWPQQDKKQYVQILTTEIKGAGTLIISKQEWRITDCVLEAELKDNYNNELRLKFSKKALFWK